MRAFRPLAARLLGPWAPPMDRQQRLRLAQAQLATALMTASVFALQLGAHFGVVDRAGLTAWTVISLAGFALVLLAIRTGWSRHLADPSLTLPQMVYGSACAAWGYAIAGTAHPVVPLFQVLILIFGMFGMTSRQVIWVATYATSLFAAVMARQCLVDPKRYPPVEDGLLFLAIAAVVAGIVMLTTRLQRMRERMRDGRAALQEALERIERLATHDELTGLVNRRRLHELLSDSGDRRAGGGTGADCVALIDLDHFKRINDSAGHAAGDAVLRGFAERGRAVLRSVDTLGRWGGEEFLLVMPGTELADALRVLERVRAHLAHAPVDSPAGPLAVTFSAGVVERRPGETTAQAIERADALCYQAKVAGRDRVESALAG